MPGPVTAGRGPWAAGRNPRLTMRRLQFTFSEIKTLPIYQAGMAKKKPASAHDDEFIDQLLDDVKDIAADPSLDQSFLHEMPADVAPMDLLLSGNDNEVTDENSTRIQGVEDWKNGDLKLKESSEVSAINPMEFPFEKLNDQKEQYSGPSANEGGFQHLDQLNEPVVESFESAEGLENEATRAIGLAEAPVSPEPSVAVSGHDRTLAADGFANRRILKNEPQEKVVIGSLRGGRAGNVLTTMDASLAQAENLKIAQQKILDLEKENDLLRQENEEVSSAADVIRHRLEEMNSRITSVERERNEVRENLQNEIMILKGNLQYKESEVAKGRLRVDELESRLRNDFKKIRVKERELENRLELARAEKSALVRAKDENILELKRKIDQFQSEIDNYREKCLELNKIVEAHQEQGKRTVRALRAALMNLEVKDENVVPLKKAD